MHIGWLSKQGRGAIVALAVSLAGAGFSAHAGLTLAPVADAPLPPPRLLGYEAQARFPGAALLYIDEPVVAHTPGATGTIALPHTPVPEAGADTSIRPARPFVLSGSILDKARALQCLTTAIYYEAASEPDDGQAAVAQVILNRARHPTFPGTVCGVIYQGSNRRGCQFSFACDGSLARVPMKSAWERARRSAARALAGHVFAPVGMATHYHTYAVAPYWSSSLVMTGVFGAHFFHRWKGWWGTPAAFTRGYGGGEPMPGPVGRVETVATASPDVAAPMAVLKPVMATAQVLPEHKESGDLQPQYAAADSQILDRWKESGKPLR